MAAARQRDRKDRDDYRKQLAKVLGQVIGDARLPCPQCGGIRYSGYWTERGPKLRCHRCGMKSFPNAAVQEMALDALGCRCSCGGKLQAQGEGFICACGKTYTWNQLAL